MQDRPEPIAETGRLQVVEDAVESRGGKAECLSCLGMDAMAIATFVESRDVGGDELALARCERRGPSHDRLVQLHEYPSGLGTHGQDVGYGRVLAELRKLRHCPPLPIFGHEPIVSSVRGRGAFTAPCCGRKDCRKVRRPSAWHRITGA